ncbi:MAG: carboxylating nicotinate-nucleotide diphosphorylase [Desulfosarcinaceae bacterium]|nr:carboxylating nicotinate-nucleotide diphosphorylase [Desulfosarcinaceae bacterium]
MERIDPAIEDLIDLALREDIGTGDITTENIVATDMQGRGEIVAKEDAVICGLAIARRVFARLAAGAPIDWQPQVADGDTVANGDTVLRIQGPLDLLLMGERTALNFLQRLSGIATQTARYVAALGERGPRIVDTRKTTPGWRRLEKYAVRTGGGRNHRMGLYDGVLIKDNHIAVAGGIAAAVAKVRAEISHLVKIEVEAADMVEVRAALAAGADIIMLDNMDGPQIAAAVSEIGGRALVEVSGGVTLERLDTLAASGVDLISIGALTHSARAVDLSMHISANSNRINGS